MARSNLAHTGIALLVAGASCFLQASVTISIDPSVTHQTIEGFGGFGKDITGRANKYIEELGVTMVRINTGEADQSVDYWVTQINAYTAEAQRLGEPILFIASSWTPPPQWKYNGRNEGTDGSTNKLKPEHYRDYANHLISFLRTIKERTGVDIYALSFQNEPLFAQPFWSCVFTPDEYLQMHKILGARIREEGLPTKLFGAEDMVDWVADSWRNYARKINDDPVAKDYLHALAVHGYSDGINPNPTSTAARTWGMAGNMARNIMGKPLWMTETSGGPQGWDGAFLLGGNIWHALKHGKAAAWVYWIMERGHDMNLLDDRRWDVSRLFYRYIRPGAVMIEAEGGNADIGAIAFHHSEDQTLTIVMLNTGPEQQVTLQGDQLPASMDVYHSSATQTGTSQGTRDPGQPLTIAAHSITTLTGSGYTPTGTGAHPHHPLRPSKPLSDIGASSTPDLLFDMRGRTIAAGRNHPSAIGLTVHSGSVRRGVLPR